MDITITLRAPELAYAIAELAQALSGRPGVPGKLEELTQNPPVELVQPQQPITAAPQQPAVPVVAVTPPVVQQQTPVQQPLIPQPVPTAAPTYNKDQLAVAATQLMDAGRQAELVALLASFGVSSLMQLPKEQYGEFATRLRAMGAKL